MTAAEATADAAAAGGPEIDLPEILSITPAPTDAERAAIVAAVEAFGAELRPRPAAATIPAPSPRWRYAGRPWRRRDNYSSWH